MVPRAVVPAVVGVGPLAAVVTAVAGSGTAVVPMVPVVASLVTAVHAARLVLPRTGVGLAAVVPPAVAGVAFPVPVMPPRGVTVPVAPLVPSVTTSPLVGPRGPGAQREQPDDGRDGGPFPDPGHALDPPD